MMRATIFPLLALLLYSAALCFANVPFLDNVGQILSGIVGSISNVSPQKQLKKFWEETHKIGPQAGHVALDEATRRSSDIAAAVGELKDAITQVIEQANKIRSDIQIAIDKKEITMDQVFYEEIKDKDEKANARAKLLDVVIDKAQAAYLRVLTEVCVSFFPKLKCVLLFICNIAGRFPFLKEVIIFSVSMFLLPKIQILRPIMTLLGFGPAGIVRGTVAAWAQRTLFGGIIPPGSWFAILQRVGMTLTGSWLEKMAVSIGLAALFGAATGGCEREEL